MTINLSKVGCLNYEKPCKVDFCFNIKNGYTIYDQSPKNYRLKREAYNSIILKNFVSMIKT